MVSGTCWERSTLPAPCQGSPNTGSTSHVSPPALHGWNRVHAPCTGSSAHPQDQRGAVFSTQSCELSPDVTVLQAAWRGTEAPTETSTFPGSSAWHFIPASARVSLTHLG